MFASKMSNQFDVFDNLNSYLDKTDDYDIPDDALGTSFDEADPCPAVPAATKAKRGTKLSKEPKLISPKKKREKPTSQTSLHSEPTEDDDDDDLESGSGSQSSLASLRQKVAAVVEVEDNGLEQQIAAVQRQYDVIFNQHKSFVDSNKKFFSGLKRRYTTLAKQFHNKNRSKTFPEKLQMLRDEMYDICVNSNLFAPVVPAVSAAPPPAVSQPPPASRPGTRRGLRGRQQEPELINLVDSPALILPGVVNLDSDEEEDCVMASNETDDFDSENYELSLKVKWDGKIERFAHRKHQKFGDLINQLASRAGADPSCVVLDINERIINPEETPDSINYRISQFISGRVMEGKLAALFVGGRQNGAKPAKPNKNLLKLKVQSDRWKQPLEVQIEKDRKMMLVVIKCAEQLKCSPSEIKLSFDGDPVEMDSTPLDLDLEGGEILDLRFVK